MDIYKGRHFSKEIIAIAVRWYVAYSLSYRNIEELMDERGVKVDHSTIQRWVERYAPEYEKRFRAKNKVPTGSSWRMDETYIRVRGKWTYLYRAVDRDGQTLEFMLSENRDTASARRFFKRAIGTNGVPERIVIDKSGANLAGLQSINVILKFTGVGRIIGIVQCKYLNNIVEHPSR